MILLVCGGRDFNNYDLLNNVLSQLENDIQIIINGGARGADRMADNWAKSRGIHSATVSALWDYYNKAAGPKRNSAMLLLKPTHCVAFPGGRGTGDMINQCKQQGVPVWEIK